MLSMLTRAELIHTITSLWEERKEIDSSIERSIVLVRPATLCLLIKLLLSSYSPSTPGNTVSVD